MTENVLNMVLKGLSKRRLKLVYQGFIFDVGQVFLYT